jgi:(p)ppGpp synthase/HD superfamily hydrolase
MDKIVNQAMWFADSAHSGQRDDNGDLYIDTHILQVVEMLQCVTDNPIILAAAYLHDTLEDTNTTLTDLEKEFGHEIASLVHEVTHEGAKDKDGYYFPRLKSKGAIMIKFADRLSNISRMQKWSEKRQEQYLKKSKFWRF